MNFKNKLMYFNTGWNFEIAYEVCGYFDNRPRLIIALVFFRMVITIPIRNKWTDECDSPKWGIAIHNNTFWVYKGGKGNMNGGNRWWTYNIHFITKKWVRSSILLQAPSESWEHKEFWEHETKQNRKDFYKKEWKEKQAYWDYEYTDKYDGEVIPARVYVEEREWRPKGLTWTKLFRTVRRSIDVHFSKEVGKRKGSWKGGVLGVGYTMLPNENPLDCIKRMEREKTF